MENAMAIVNATMFLKSFVMSFLRPAGIQLSARLSTY